MPSLRELQERVKGAWTAMRGQNPYGSYPVPTSVYGRWSTEAERFDVLDAYEANDRLYQRIATELAAAGYVGYSGFRNPASRLIDLYAAKLTDRLIDSLDTGTNDYLRDRIRDVYEWSNWVDRCEEAARELTTHGILFVKLESVREDEDDPNSPFDRVQRLLLDPRHVVNWKVDGRDILTYLRLDVPYIDEQGDERVVTEEWSKAARTYRKWDHDLDPGADLEDIADTRAGRSELVESAVLASPENALPGEHITGWDFIPVVVRTIRKKRSSKWGRGVFEHALDSIDELNRQATKLSRMMFPDVYATLERDVGSRGGDLPPTYREPENALSRQHQEEYRVVDIEGVKTARFPAGVRMGWSFPQYDFTGHLAAMDNFVKESIEKDMPELAYYRLREWSTPPSGIAAETLTDDIRDRILNVRRKFEDMDVRLNKMALTMAKACSIEGFEAVGDYRTGELDHRFKPYKLFNTMTSEEGKAEADAITALKPYPAALRRYLEKQGYEERAIVEIMSDPAPAQASTSAAVSVLEAARQRRLEAQQSTQGGT